MSEYETKYDDEPYDAASHDYRMKDAKPCPFCGSLNLKLAKSLTHIHCNSCNADGPEGRLELNDNVRWQQTLKNWNRRYKGGGLQNATGF